MLRFLSDEDFNGHVLQALMNSDPTLDVLRALDVGLGSTRDQDVLEWAAQAGRIVLSRDRGTMTKHAYDRIRAGLPMPGVVVTRDSLPVAIQVQDILTVTHCSLPGELDDQVMFLPI